MSEAETCAEKILRALPKVKFGSLRIWGEWFGKPYDNHHTIKACKADGDLLQLEFDQSEKLLVWSPTTLTVDESTFRITGANLVRWEWYCYGRPMTPSNLYFEDFVNALQSITVATNIDWYNPKFKPKRSEPAVELL